MRNFKKFVTVGLTAAMTTAMSLVAMASTDVTIHFKNAAKWDNVGIWIYQGVGWTKNISPKDACPAYHESTDPKIASHPIWPGARMEAEADYNGWYKITVPFDDTSNGAVMIFNNLIADTVTDTTTGGDAADQKIVEGSGLIMDTNAKKQTPNQTIIPPQFTSGATEFWCDFDGNVAGSSKRLLDKKPDSYTKQASTKVDNLEAVGASDKEIKLTWTKYKGAASYKISYLKSKKFSKVGTSTKASYSVKKIGGKAIKAGQTYTFKVEAYDKSGNKLATSSEVQGVALATPKIKSVTNTKKGRVTVKVGSVKGASGYIIYRSNKQKSGYIAIGSTAKGATSYTDKTVKKGKTYYYKAAAYKTTATGKASAQLSAYKKIKVKK